MPHHMTSFHFKTLSHHIASPHTPITQSHPHAPTTAPTQGDPGVHIAVWGTIDPYSMAVDATLGIPLDTLETLHVIRSRPAGTEGEAGAAGAGAGRGRGMLLQVRATGKAGNLWVDWPSLAKQIAVIVLETSMEAQVRLRHYMGLAWGGGDGA